MGRKAFALGAFVGLLIASEAPYHPYPIIFVHGYYSRATIWGANIKKGNPEELKKTGHKYTFAYMLDSLMMPYILANPSSLALSASGFYNIPGQKQGGFGFEA